MGCVERYEFLKGEHTLESGRLDAVTAMAAKKEAIEDRMGILSRMRAISSMRDG